MKFRITSPAPRLDSFSFNIPINNLDIRPEITLTEFQNMWKLLCENRSSKGMTIGLGRDKYYSGTAVYDIDGYNGVATSINTCTIFDMIMHMLNAYIPTDVGCVWIEKTFNSAVVCASQIQLFHGDAGFDHEDIQPLLPNQYGIFTFMHYSEETWSKYPENTIADTGRFIGFPICDYSQICINLVRAQKDHMHPMVWVNPRLLEAFIIAYDKQNNFNVLTLQLLISKYIICAAFDHEGKVRESGVKEIWAAVSHFINDHIDVYEELCQLTDASNALIYKYMNPEAMK